MKLYVTQENLLLNLSRFTKLEQFQLGRSNQMGLSDITASE
jgi:hypothetical protein